ncbi:uncharacterized protein LOC103577211 [Microplitis demolitor]|uniref:uncharacterized protein LOC103577211 n=1 Tax=Microplitis demolitor TaxID=69319 RepID=UPI00235B5E59|nr:uncharacterized protein LOC103577211 [Microplitis demolitor]
MTTILPQSFFILTCIGLWRPVDWQGWKCILYDMYSYFVVVTNFAFSLSQLLDIILVRTSINELTNNMTMLLVMVTACGKILGILRNRNEILQIIKSLEEKPFKPRDQYEIDIRNKYIYVRISGILLTRIPEAKLPDVLPFSSWLPYNYSNPKIYLLTAAQQIINSLISTYAQVGFDTLFPGMMMYVSAQTNILQYRFKKVIKALEKINLKNCADQVKNHKDAEKNIITEWVECHIAVLRKFKFADLNDEMYNTDWFNLSINAKKSMIIIVLKTFQPVVFMSGYIVTLSIESFKSVMKLSYSIYNMLGQVGAFGKIIGVLCNHRMIAYVE